MADLDTRNKRASAIGFDAIERRVYPNPDGVIDVFDRQQTAGKYAGIDTTVVVGGNRRRRVITSSRQ